MPESFYDYVDDKALTMLIALGFIYLVTESEYGQLCFFGKFARLEGEGGMLLLPACLLAQFFFFTKR